LATAPAKLARREHSGSGACRAHRTMCGSTSRAENSFYSFRPAMADDLLKS